MDTEVISKSRPSRATLFHLIPIGPKATEILKSPTNKRYVSLADDDNPGLEIGFHLPRGRSHTIIASLEGPDDLAVVADDLDVSGDPDDSTTNADLVRPWRIVFEYMPEAEVVLLQEIHASTDESLLKVYREYGYSDREGTPSRVLTFGERYLMTLGDQGPQFRIVWACKVLDRSEESLSRAAKRAFRQSRKSNVSAASIMASARARTNHIVDTIARGVRPLIDQFMDGDKRELIAEGGFAKVYKDVTLLDGIQVAVKICRVNSTDVSRRKAYARTTFEREIKVLQKLRHPNIIELLGMSIGDTLQIVMPLRDSNLASHMTSVPGPRRINLCQQFYSQILPALHFLHSKNVIHRDLKPENVLCQNVFCQTKGVQYTKYQLADFGLANKSTSAITICGTPEFMAPECASKEGKKTPKIDIYAFFVCMTEVLEPVLRVGWRSTKEPTMADLLYMAKRHGILQPFAGMLDYDPAVRPSAEELLSNWLWEAPQPGESCSPPVYVSLAFAQNERNPVRVRPPIGKVMDCVSKPEALHRPGIARHPRPVHPTGGMLNITLAGDTRLKRWKFDIKAPDKENLFPPQRPARKDHIADKCDQPGRLSRRLQPTGAHNKHRVSKPKPLAEIRNLASMRRSEFIAKMRIPGAFPTDNISTGGRAQN